MPLSGTHSCLSLPTLTSEQVRVQQLLLDDVIGHHLSTVDNGISCDVGPSPC